MESNNHKKKKVPLKELKKPRPGDTLQKIIDDYDSDRLACWKQIDDLRSMEDLICGKPGNPFYKENGEIYYKRASHQKHMINSTIKDATSELQKLEPTLKKSKDFEALYNEVKKINVWGFGPLATYDFSLRFGYKHGLKPEKYVYVHAGTLEGAKELKRLKPSMNWKGVEELLLVDELPAPLQKLESMDIENLLCIFKERLKNLKKL